MRQTKPMTETRGITDEQILDALREHGGAGTSEVVDADGDDETKAGI